MRKAKKTNELLQHEQGHLDLLVLCTRALATELESLEALSAGSLVEQIQTVSTKHDERAEAIDAAYDEKTEHSRNKAAQLTWDKAIADAMGDPKCSALLGMPL